MGCCTCPTYLKIFILLAAPAAADGTGVNHRYDDGKFRRVGEEMTLCSAVLFPGPPDLSGIYPAAVGGTQDEGITQDPQLLVKTGQQVNKHPSKPLSLTPVTWYRPARLSIRHDDAKAL